MNGDITLKHFAGVKFGTNVQLVNVINPDKLCVNLFKGFDFTGVKVSIFSIGNWRRRYNSAALPRSLWLRLFRTKMQIQYKREVKYIHV